MKKTGVLLLAVIVLILGILGWAGLIYYQQSAVKNLEISLQAVSIEKITWTATTIGFTLSLYNPGIITAKVNTFDATLYANGIGLAELILDKPVRIPSGKNVKKSFLLELNNTDLGIALISALKERDVRWAVNGTYNADYWFGTYPHKFEINS